MNSTPNSDGEDIFTLAADFPVEDILQKLSERLWERMKGEPTQDVLEDFQGLLWLSEKALETIVTIDSKCRPQEEWMAALESVENIRDEVADTIEMLKLV